MPQITIRLAEVKRLIAFCKTHGKTQYFIAKDHGAYLGATTGAAPAPQCLFYFKGCDPRVDTDDYYDNARYAFGGDDFGCNLELSTLENMLTAIEKEEAKLTAGGKKFKPVKSICWKVTPRTISFRPV
jgi:hypothetical protein